MTNKEVVEKVIQAFNRADLEQLCSLLTDDVIFCWPGSFEVGPGKEAVRKFFEICPQILDSSVGRIIQENDMVVANGSVTTKHEDGSVRKSHFCDLYQMEHGKVKFLESYVVFEKSNRHK